VEGAVQCGLIPLEAQNSTNSVDFSSPLSILKLLTVLPISHLANNTHSFKALIANNLAGSK
jgi:hypothetical protein